MTPLTLAIGWSLVDFIWQGLAVGGTAALALRFVHAPRQRYFAACCALLLCAVLPFHGFVTRLDDATAAVTLPFATAAMSADSGGDLIELVNAHLATLVACWATIAALLALRLLAGLAWIRHMATRTDAINHALQEQVGKLALACGISRQVRVRVVSTVASPVTAGWLRPVILVPAALLTGLPPNLLDALLLHELAHIRRFDYLVNLVQNVIETLLFYHPAVWWLSRQIRIEREKIADDLAAATLNDPHCLALALSKLEFMQFSAPALAQAANGADLTVRIRRLLRPQPHASNWKAAAILAMMVLAAAAHYSQARTAAGPSTKPAKVNFSTCQKPRYPAESLARGDVGTVVLKADVDAQGQARSVSVSSGSGHALLDETARSALARCRFSPAMLDGRPVPAWSTIRYVWRTGPD